MHYNSILCMNVPDTTKDSKTIDSVKEYEFHYTVPGDKRTMVGSGRGATEEEVKADFMKFHKSENPTITMSKLYKVIDKAIQACDAVEVETSRWQFSSGKRSPSGFGRWFFKIGSEEKFFNGSYTEAKKAATKYASENGISTIYLLP